MGLGAFFSEVRSQLRVFGRSLKPLATRLVQDEGGQGTLEYILILSFTVVGATTLARTILKTLDDGILTFGGQLEKDLHTGKAPVDVWSN